MFVAEELFDALIHIHLLAILEGDDECLGKFIQYALTQSVDGVIVVA